MTAYAPLPRNTRKLEDGFARTGFQCTHSAHESDIASVYSTASEIRAAGIDPVQPVKLLRSRRSTDQLDGKLRRGAKAAKTPDDPSLNHLVRALLHRLWDRQADLLRRCQIDDELKLVGQLDGQITRPRALEDLLDKR